MCKCGGYVETAPGPDRAAPGSRYSLAFAIKVVLDKYVDHIPLERQTRIMASVDRSNPASCGRVKSGQLLQDGFV